MTEKSPRVKISGLWAGETKDGVRYLSGGNGSVRYSIWPNGYKDQDENQPSHVLYVEQAKKKEDAGDDAKGGSSPF